MTKILDCSIGEGGGSIVRISVALAATTASSLKLINIRSKRTNPGLRAQHLEAISAIRQLSGLSFTGSHIGSQNLDVHPSNELQEENKAIVNIKTAGSVALVAQAVLYYAFSQRRNLSLEVIGGATHGKWAPSIEYVEHVTHALLKSMNKNIRQKIKQYGFYPKGGAKCLIEFQSHDNLSPLSMVEKGKLEEIEVFSIASDYLAKRKVAERQINTFIKDAKPSVNIISNIQYTNTLSSGSGLTIINRYSNGSRKGCFVPGERNLSSEQVGKICSTKWSNIERSKAAVDEYAADQLIVPMALCEEESEITVDKITNHTKTNIELVKSFIHTPIEIKKEDDFFRISVNH